jgi:hypothetical protein
VVTLSKDFSWQVFCVYHVVTESRFATHCHVFWWMVTLGRLLTLLTPLSMYFHLWSTLGLQGKIGWFRYYLDYFRLSYVAWFRMVTPRYVWLLSRLYNALPLCFTYILHFWSLLSILLHLWSRIEWLFLAFSLTSITLLDISWHMVTHSHDWSSVFTHWNASSSSFKCVIMSSLVTLFNLSRFLTRSHAFSRVVTFCHA